MKMRREGLLCYPMKEKCKYGRSLPAVSNKILKGNIKLDQFVNIIDIPAAIASGIGMVRQTKGAGWHMQRIILLTVGLGDRWCFNRKQSPILGTIDANLRIFICKFCAVGSMERLFG